MKEGFRIFRIPGAKEKEYDILNLSGDVMRKTIGKDLMKHFDDRTQTHKKNKSFK